MEPPTPPDRIDHIGVDLYRAAEAFERAMFAAVAEKGFDDIGLADSEILVAIPPQGARVTAVAAARRVTKQAAQEGIQSLVRRGYVIVGPDPNDRRARLVVLSGKGVALHAALNQVKRELDARITAHLGAEETARLRTALAAILPILGAPEDR